MDQLEDSNGSISFWRERLEQYGEWNSMPKETRKRLLKDLQRAIIALARAHLTEKEILNFLTLTDVPTVFDAVITTAMLPDLESKNSFELKAYMAGVIKNAEKARLAPKPKVHKHVEPKRKKKRGKPVTIEYLKEYNPYNFKKHYCKICKNRIRSDNVTGICTKCQKSGKNGDSSEY